MSEKINSEEIYDNLKIIKIEDYEIQILHKLFFFFQNIKIQNMHIKNHYHI